MRLLVDGHNLIGRMPDLALSDQDDEAQLVSRLRRYAFRTGNHVVVVFDGGRPGAAQSVRPGEGVHVLFAPAGETADQQIIRRIRRIRDKTAWCVVSTDRAILAEAAWAGVPARRSEEMATELAALPSAPGATDPRQSALTRSEVEAWMAEFSRARVRKG